MAGKCPCCGAQIKINECEYCGFVERLPESDSPAEVIHKHIYVYDEPAPQKTIVKEVVREVIKEVPYTPISSKSRLTALILCIFLGWIGGHRFYAGKIGTGLLYLFTFGFWGIGVFIDFILIAMGQFREKNGLLISKWK